LLSGCSLWSPDD